MVFETLLYILFLIKLSQSCIKRKTFSFHLPQKTYCSLFFSVLHLSFFWCTFLYILRLLLKLFLLEYQVISSNDSFEKIFQERFIHVFYKCTGMRNPHVFQVFQIFSLLKSENSPHELMPFIEICSAAIPQPYYGGG